MDPISWTKPPFDDATCKEVQRLMKEDPKILSDSFFQRLSFGTGGMRGLMGVGTNRVNIYTIRAATEGLCQYLIKSVEGKKRVFIGYDTRKNSRLFAEEAARVLAFHDIEVLITHEMCPTPMVSFGCRHFAANAAIMITASHNPPSYNGYKVYWQSGGQIVAPQDKEIMKEVEKVVDFGQIGHAPINSTKIRWIGSELDDAYLKELEKLKGKSYPLRILYTPLHGTGLRIAKKAFHIWGFNQVELVEKQATMDPEFPFAPSPNPEEESAMRLGMDLLIHKGFDLLVATDPDADRMGVAIHHEGIAHRFTGHQIASLLLYHLCKTRTISPHSACIKTIVTTELFKKIANHFHLQCFDVLTGFKYIGEKMTEWEKAKDALHYLFGAEESFGYLFGTMVRDKDGINAGCLIAEAASHAKKEGKTLLDLLHQIYSEFGIHRESLLNLKFSDSQEGMEKMKKLMDNLRKNPPHFIHKTPVIHVDDYLKTTFLPKSDVLTLWLKDGTKIVVRPSGTEPKVKIYLEVVQDPKNPSIEECDARLKNYENALLFEIGEEKAS